MNKLKRYLIESYSLLCQEGLSESAQQSNKGERPNLNVA
jgi:hypothetical protein